MNMHIGAPEKPQDSLYYRTDIFPETLFKAIGRLRKEARDEIDRLIRFLDETDNHVAIEDCAIDDGPCDHDELELGEGDDEPTLGWTDAGTIGKTRDLEIGQVAP